MPALALDSLAGTLSPGDRAQVVGLFPDGWGPGGKNQGSVWVTLVGSGIFQSTRLDLAGQTLVHGFEVERRFGSAVYAQVAYRPYDS